MENRKICLASSSSLGKRIACSILPEQKTRHKEVTDTKEACKAKSSGVKILERRGEAKIDNN